MGYVLKGMLTVDPTSHVNEQDEHAKQAGQSQTYRPCYRQNLLLSVPYVNKYIAHTTIVLFLAGGLLQISKKSDCKMHSLKIWIIWEHSDVSSVSQLMCPKI